MQRVNEEILMLGILSSSYFTLRLTETARVESAPTTSTALTAAIGSTEAKTGETTTTETGCWSPSAALAGERKSGVGRGSIAGLPILCAE